jgi:hypothetical protein
MKYSATVSGRSCRAYRKSFPCDWLLAAFVAESFVCVPLVDHDGCFVGLLGVLDHRELERVDIVEAYAADLCRTRGGGDRAKTL